MKKIRVTKVKTHASGDIEYKVLADDENDMSLIKWSIIFIIVAFLCYLFLKSWCLVDDDIFFCVSVVVFIGLFTYLVLDVYLLDRIEGKFVKRAIGGCIIRDAVERNQKVLRVRFCSDSLDSYGTNDEEYVLVLLGDKTVLKYPIRQLNGQNEKFYHKLIVSKCEICENDIQKRLVLKKSMILKLISSPFFVSLATWGVIALILGLGLGILYLFVDFMYNAKDSILPFAAFLVLLLFMFLNDLAEKKLSHNRLGNFIRIILSIPFIVLGITKLVMPFLTIFVALCFMLAYSFFPVFVVCRLVEAAGYNILIEGKLFLFLTIPLIIATHCSDWIRGRILRKTPFRENDHHYHLFMRELVRFVYTKGNLNFIVYSSYFLFLFISTFKNIQCGEALLSADLDMIVAKAFLVYIACTNMLDRKKSSNLESGALLKLFVKMMIAHDDETWRMKRKSHQLDG